MLVSSRNASRHPPPLVAMAPHEGFVYVPGFLTPSEHDELLDRLRALHFDHDVFRGQRLKRGWAQFGFQYLSTGRRPVEAPPLPPFLTRLVETGSTLCPDHVETVNTSGRLPLPGTVMSNPRRH